MMMLSCSTTTVHVNETYLTEIESNNIKNRLEKLGLTVEFNEHTYPDDIASTTILYSPFLKETSAVNNVENTLLELGYDINNINSLVASNHWYTKNTMGLYIIPRGVDPHNGKSVEDIAKQYKSVDCDNLAELNLYKNGKFLYSSKGEKSVSGQWSITEYPYIILKKTEPYLDFYFEIKKSTKSDQISKIEVTELQPINNSDIISDCTLTYGIRL